MSVILEPAARGPRAREAASGCVVGPRCRVRAGDSRPVARADSSSGVARPAPCRAAPSPKTCRMQVLDRPNLRDEHAVWPSGLKSGYADRSDAGG